MAPITLGKPDILKNFSCSFTHSLGVRNLMYFGDSLAIVRDCVTQFGNCVWCLVSGVWLLSGELPPNLRVFTGMIPSHKTEEPQVVRDVSESCLPYTHGLQV